MNQYTHWKRLVPFLRRRHYRLLTFHLLIKVNFTLHFSTMIFFWLNSLRENTFILCHTLQLSSALFTSAKFINTDEDTKQMREKNSRYDSLLSLPSQPLRIFPSSVRILKQLRASRAKLLGAKGKKNYYEHPEREREREMWAASFPAVCPSTTEESLHLWYRGEQGFL